MNQEQPCTDLQKVEYLRRRLEEAHKAFPDNPIILYKLGVVYSTLVEQRAGLYEVFAGSGLVEENRFEQEQDNLSRKSRKALTAAVNIVGRAFESELSDKLEIEIFQNDSGA